MIATRNGFEVLSCNLRLVFSTHVDLLDVLTTSRISNPGHLSTGETVFVGKKRLNTMRALGLTTRRSKKP